MSDEFLPNEVERALMALRLEVAGEIVDSIRNIILAEFQRNHPKSCVAGSLGTSIMLRDGTKVCLVRGENAHHAHVWLEVRDAERVYLADNDGGLHQ